MILALHGISKWTPEQVTANGWWLLLLACFLPGCLILLSGFLHPAVILLSVGQAAAIVLGLRTAFRVLRPRVPEFLLGLALCPAYVLVCLGTNIVFLAGLALVLRFL